MIAAATVAAFFVAEAGAADAAKKQQDATPSFHDCFDLGWVRGMHLENNELPAWVEECQGGNIPLEHTVSTKEKARARHGKPNQTE